MEIDKMVMEEALTTAKNDITSHHKELHKVRL
jgi:hypothetical protein